MTVSKQLICVCVCAMLAACSTSRYQQQVDSTPVYSEVISRLPEPKPIREPLSKRGNSPEYQVWGKTYKVNFDTADYQEAGIASWYGQKFHGYETSNGEIFNVYEFTAAHKHLPLPSYVRVTNQANGSSLVVRVNDRGPFHGNRVIDLSYAAAVRLGFADNGTAPVLVEMLAAPYLDADYKFIQVAAFSALDNAQRLQEELKTWLEEAVYINQEVHGDEILHKVRIGPVKPDRLSEVQTILLSKNLTGGLVLP